MKRLSIILLVLTCGVCFVTSRAFMQGGLLQSRGSQKKDRSGDAPRTEAPKNYLNNNKLHKLILKENDMTVYQQLAKRKAIRQELNYGGYRLVVVDEDQLGGRAAIEALPVVPHDELNMIFFNGYVIDTSQAQPLDGELPADLKQSRMSEMIARRAEPARGLYLVQFAGPIQGAWRKALEKTGAAVISYAPNNAYVVRADERAASELLKLKESTPFVQWMGDYEPAYKLTPGLRALRSENQPIKVTVQVLDNDEGRLRAEELKKASSQYFGEYRVLNYRNITVMIPPSQLAELAQSDVVLAVEESFKPVLLDEAQGQIVAGNLSGNSPSGPGYLAWLGSKGFNSSQFGSFSINVVDDAYSLSGHPDLPDSRIAFQHNPTAQTGPQRGHGFLNAHIVGGFNNGTGSAYEDANGYNYGLGIAPWARVGLTAIFGQGFASPEEWEDAAYLQGSRISTNSWGLLGATDYSFYDQLYDSLVRDAQLGVPGNQPLTVLFAAGNSASKVESPGLAKNVITVGASENVRPTGTDGCGSDNSTANSANDLAPFSSRGTNWGYIKPDLVAPGVHIQAGIPQSDYAVDRANGLSVCDRYFPAGQTLYSWSTGTSHSTPAVAGGAALIYQDFLNKGSAPPSPAMIKAILMNSASYLTGVGGGDTLPSANQGMGRMDLGRALDGTPRLLTDQTRTFESSGEVYRVFGSIAATDRPLRVTLAWSDAPGAAIGPPWVNNLDLEVTVNGQTYQGNVFSGPNSTTGGIPDGRNNVESVFLPAGVSGNFLVTIRAINIAGDGVPGNENSTDQDFALVIYNANATTPTQPITEINPKNLNFSGVAGDNNPPAQTIEISNLGAGALNWTASVNVPWLAVSPVNGTAPSTLSASVNTTGLAPGTYLGTITISSTNALNPQLNVPVTLTISPTLTVNLPLGDFRFGHLVGTTPPGNRVLTLINNHSAPQSWTASDDAPWLTINPTSGTTPTNPVVSVNTTGMQPGLYNATITIIPTNVPHSPLRVPVLLIIDNAYTASPTPLRFITRFGGENPDSQTTEIMPTNPLHNDWTTSATASWLIVNPANGSGRSILTVSVNSEGLAPGVYNAAVAVRSPAAPDFPTLIPVTLTVDRLANGGFETRDVYWALSGIAQRSAGRYPHTDAGYLILGAANGSKGSASQEVILPSRSPAKLSFWLNVTSTETTTTEKRDQLFLEVLDTRGRLLKMLATFSNLDKTTPGIYTMRGNYNLAQFAGQTVRLQFRTKTDSSSLTTFRIDDVMVR